MVLEITFYSKPDCPLCDKAMAHVENAKQRFQINVNIVDITKDPALFELYCFDIPVVVVNNQIEIKGIISHETLYEALRIADTRT